MQIQQRPRFRQDLVAEPVDDNGARFIDLLDPDTGNLFRFYEVEYSLACAMDGERDVAGIVQWAREELGLTPSPNEVKTVIATLGELGYLEGGGAAAQPGARPARDAEALAPGILVGQRHAQPASVDMELGHAPARAQLDAEIPEAPDLELGAPGVVPARRSEAPSVGDIPLGQSGRGAQPPVESRPQVSDLSLDLSEQMSVGADDVKEAVRQSQVMRAVDVPPELLESAESPPKSQKPGPEARVEARPSLEQPAHVESKPDRKPAVEQPARTEARPKPAVDLPKQPQPSQPRAPTVEPRSVSPVFILLLVLAVVAAGAFFAWRYLLNKESKQQQSVLPAQPVEPVKPPTAVKPPPAETAKLTADQPEPQDLKPTAAGQIETILAKDAVVKPGDIVARLAGDKPIETEVLGIQRDIEKRVQPELAQAEKDRDAAQAAGNKPGVTAAETRIADRKKSLDDKQGKLAAKQAELDKYLIKSPVAGKVTVPTKASTRVTPSDSVAKIVRAPTLVTMLHSPTEIAPNTKVILKVVGETEQKLTCTATTTTADGVRIVCAGDVAPAGTEVTLVGVDATQPAPTNGSGGGEIEMGDESSGSAAGGSAASGSAASGSAASGSAVTAPAPPKAPPPRPHPVRPQPKPPQPKPPEGSDKAADPTPAPAAPAGSAS